MLEQRTHRPKPYSAGHDVIRRRGYHWVSENGMAERSRSAGFIEDYLDGERSRNAVDDGQKMVRRALMKWKLRAFLDFHQFGIEAFCSTVYSFTLRRHWSFSQCIPLTTSGKSVKHVVSSRDNVIARLLRR